MDTGPLLHPAGWARHRLIEETIAYFRIFQISCEPLSRLARKRGSHTNADPRLALTGGYWQRQESSSVQKQLYGGQVVFVQLFRRV